MIKNLWNMTKLAISIFNYFFAKYVLYLLFIAAIAIHNLMT